MASFPYFKCHTVFQRFKDLYIAPRKILNLQEESTQSPTLKQTAPPHEIHGRMFEVDK